MKNRFRIPALEIHAAHVCNLRCQGCTHYSNFGTRGIVSVEEARSWIEPWKERIHPGVIAILGGEPTLNPDLPEFLEMTAQCWPGSKLQLITNGFHLDQHPSLPEVLVKNNVLLVVSIHDDSESYHANFEKVRDLVKSWHLRHKRLPFVYVNSHKRWRHLYRTFGSEIFPCHSQDFQCSYQFCQENRSLQLFYGKLWKCPLLTYLHLPEVREQLSEEWASYLVYQPLSSDASDDALSDFLSLKAEPYCAMCACN